VLIRKPYVIFNKQNYLQKRAVSGIFKIFHSCGIPLSFRRLLLDF
jgi:hypothetical protein